MSDVVRLRHNRIELALHPLRRADGPTLLLLHGLGESAPPQVPDPVAAWPGAVWALDFTGHGRSDVPAGGGYTAEVLMGDADAALAHLGRATLHGRGLGAYVALLLIGARPTTVRGAVLDDGPGLAGGGSQPGSAALVRIPDDAPRPPDPFALAELSRDVRPPDYAAGFVRQVTHLSDLDPAIAVSARIHPPWLAAVAGEVGVVSEPTAAALARFARSGW
ncbi:MAG TPA: alpha/beta hydrolase [Acidimicrobiales bacterium]|nr:alpha/beta hydrolase [Acidimicrobiales bacterium]